MEHDVVKIAEEQEAIESFVELDVSYVVKQYPIILHLDEGDSIPDAIVINKKNNQKYWLEVVTISRTLQEREEVGKLRSGAIWEEPDQSIFDAPVDFQLFEDEIYQQICRAIYKKNQKNYTRFAELYNLELSGILLVRLINFRPFLDVQMLSQVKSRFDIELLRSLGCDKHIFNKIVLIADILVHHRYRPYLIIIVDEAVMQKL